MPFSPSGKLAVISLVMTWRGLRPEPIGATRCGRARRHWTHGHDGVWLSRSLENMRARRAQVTPQVTEPIRYRAPRRVRHRTPGGAYRAHTLPARSGWQRTPITYLPTPSGRLPAHLPLPARNGITMAFVAYPRGQSRAAWLCGERNRATMRDDAVAVSHHISHKQ